MVISSYNLFALFINSYFPKGVDFFLDEKRFTSAEEIIHLAVVQIKSARNFFNLCCRIKKRVIAAKKNMIMRKGIE